MVAWREGWEKHKEKTAAKWRDLEEKRLERNRIGNLTGIDLDTGEFKVPDQYEQDQPFILNYNDTFEASVINLVLKYREAARSKTLLDNIRAALNDGIPPQSREEQQS